MKVSTSICERNVSFAIAILVTMLFPFQNVVAQGTQDRFVGTWHIKVPVSDQGFPSFEALQTYHVGGTMSEVSSNLPALAETPAFGVWAKNGSGYDMTFQLFIFDSTGASAGRVQVRTFIELVGADSLKAKNCG